MRFTKKNLFLELTLFTNLSLKINFIMIHIYTYIYIYVYVNLFLTYLIEKLKKKYSFARTMRTNRILDEEIPIPWNYEEENIDLSMIKKNNKELWFLWFSLILLKNN